MKLKYVILILFILVVLMVHDPKRTTAEITTGEQGAAGAGSAVFGGFFTAPSKKKVG